jgi:prepilin-type N-terminal cleavage/methylation domain-containing protein
MKQIDPRIKPTAIRTHSGFTLVEMLIATALVLLMMLLFAQVFQTSAGLISNQKGMANQDQRVRTMTIMLEGDIGQRTFRDVIPFYNPDGVPIPKDDRTQGFFSISENDPNNNGDDVLHLTVMTYDGKKKKTFRGKGPAELPYSGKATLIRYADSNDPDSTDPPDDLIDERAEREAYLFANPNQPEFDDGQLSFNENGQLSGNINGTGSSRFAEVVWFLRNGTLYRRMLLIREPYDTGNATEGANQPKRSADNENLIPADYTALNVPPITPADNWHDAAGRFWYDFDYSAFNDPQNEGGNGLRFHSAGEDGVSLDNEHPAGTSLGSFPGIPPSLGIPCLRFGNSLRRALQIDDLSNNTLGTRAVGIAPREFLDPGLDPNTPPDPSTFIGRYTMQETAHSAFTYPSSDTPDGGGPFDPATNNLTLGTDGLVAEYSGELGRRGEDIVMTNVHAFDIQVWDDALKEYVNLGHDRQNANGAIGDFNAEVTGGGRGGRNPANTLFGNRYDTWHPNDGLQPPPYRPVFVDPATGEATPKPLQAIRILIRFYDVGSDSMRDLTFTFPLIEK